MAKEIRVITKRYNKKFRKKWNFYMVGRFKHTSEYEQTREEYIDKNIAYEPNIGIWAKERKQYVDKAANSMRGIVYCLNGFLEEMGFTERLKLDVECYRKRLYKKYEVKE
jgi:hypothetical protein